MENPRGGRGQFIRGNGLQKKDFTETGVPAIHYGQIYTNSEELPKEIGLKQKIIPVLS